MPNAMTPNDLPTNSPDSASCDAARAGEAVMKISGFPGEFQMRFIGTGMAVVPVSARNVFDVNHDQDSVEMSWYQNKFVGRHWFLGDFEINLSDSSPSTGTIKAVGTTEFGLNTININDFYFDFKFKRFPFLNMTNVTPIRNAAVVSAIPPVGSIFKLVKPDGQRYLFRRGTKRLVADESGVPEVTVDFKQCDVTVFSDKNVGLNLLEKIHQPDGSYRVTVEIENTTTLDAIFAYFSVIHYGEIATDNDYGFAPIRAGEKTSITFTVTSTLGGRTVDLPFWAALYEPKDHQGSKSLPLMYEF